jgi:hypothetical protein
MANRIPLIYNTDANQIQEIGAADTLDVAGSNVAVGIMSATIYTHPSTISESIVLDQVGNTYAHFGEVSVGSGSTVAVASGVSYIILSKQN